MSVLRTGEKDTKDMSDAEFIERMRKYAARACGMFSIGPEVGRLLSLLARTEKALDLAIKQRNLVHAEECDDVKCMAPLNDQIAKVLEGT